MEKKKCASPNCGWKDLDSFYHDRTRPDRKTQYCKDCINARSKQRYQKTRAARKNDNVKYRMSCKREAMNHYGSVCQCCGEHRLEFLTLDHVNNDGAEHRRNMGFSHSCTGYNFYLWLKQRNWPDLGLQVLCSNCNTAKAWGRQCPHVTERETKLTDGLGI